MKPTDDEIRALAYRLWHERGCPDDSLTRDWLEAERILTAQGASKGRLDITEVSDALEAEARRKKMAEYGLSGKKLETTEE